MEFVVVHYQDERDVYINGQMTGKTNETLVVGEGHQKFDLGLPKDYEPLSQEVLVENTTEITPLEIKFTFAGDPV